MAATPSGCCPSTAEATAAAACDARPAAVAARDGGAPSFHQRVLPSPPCTAFASAGGRRLFAEALAEGGMDAYFFQAQVFQRQGEPAYCGLATLSMCLNALGVDPRRQFRGPWRWYEEAHLDCCVPLEAVRSSGVTLEQLHCLAVCNGLQARVERAASLEAFRADVRAVTRSAAADTCLALSYSRATLGQTGDGHFSPVGGYHEASDQVLILDVAQFKYPPHWVPLGLVHQALQTRDSATGRVRGYMVLRRASGGGDDSLPVAYRPSRALPWVAVREALRAAGTAAVRGAATLREALEAAGVPGGSPARLLEVAEDAADEAEAAELRAQLRASPARGVARALCGGPAAPDEDVDLAALALLAVPPAAWPPGDDAGEVGSAARRALDEASPLLRREAAALRRQLVELSRGA